MRRIRYATGVSVVELVIAIVILGLIAALAIPRFSRAGQSTPEDELRHRLSVLRTAIELYRSEHAGYPGTLDGQTPADAASVFVAQLSGRTTADGRSCGMESSGCRGPYIREGLPRSPLQPAVSGVSGRVFIWSGSAAPQADATIEADWIFDCRTGYLIVNHAGSDSEGKRFDQY